MLSLIFRDSDGNETHYIKEIYDLSWSYVDKGGPLQLTAILPVNLIMPKIDVLYDVSLYDGLDEIWLGRVSEVPRVTRDRKAAAIIVSGYIDSLTDDPFMRMYSDTDYSGWSTNSPVAATASWNWDICTRDNNNRLYIKIPKDQAIDASLISGLYYRRCHPDEGIDQTVYSVTFGYETGASYNTAQAKLCLYSYDSGFTNPILEWSLAGAGALSGSASDTTTASKKALAFVLDGQAAHTPVDENYWASITNIRVNGLSSFTGSYTTDAVIKDALALKCPQISTDYTMISAGTYTLPNYYQDKLAHTLSMVKDLNSYEGYNYGFYDRDSSGDPRFTFESHDKTKIHYRASLRNVRPDLSGKSLSEQYNKSFSTYLDDVTQVTKYGNSTGTNALLSKWGITRAPESPIQVDTSSSTRSQQVRTIFLDDKEREQAKGSLVICGTVRDWQGREIDAHRIIPGRNIMIYDLEADPSDLDLFSASDVLNGKNVFRIIQTDVNYSSKETTLQVDNLGDRLDLAMAKMGV